tara:strand:+ start:1914 stop:2504 length:591 start_codon:yes stop_codon:yes gene_type:complete
MTRARRAKDWALVNYDSLYSIVCSMLQAGDGRAVAKARAVCRLWKQATNDAWVSFARDEYDRQTHEVIARPPDECARQPRPPTIAWIHWHLHRRPLFEVEAGDLSGREKRAFYFVYRVRRFGESEWGPWNHIHTQASSVSFTERHRGRQVQMRAACTLRRDDRVWISVTPVGPPSSICTIAPYDDVWRALARRDLP